jgi:hypothetical protein
LLGAALGAADALGFGNAVGDVMAGAGASAGLATGVALPLPQVAAAGFRGRLGRSSSSGCAAGVGATASSALGRRGPV